MGRDEGVGVFLSFAVVGLVAVAFYRPERSSPGPSARRPAERVSAPDAMPSLPLPKPSPGIPLAEAAPASPTLPRSPLPSSPIRPASSRRVDKHWPRSAFAVAADGETLADVARRVYGTDAAAEELWKANRDQVERPEDPLRAGTLLRTP